MLKFCARYFQHQYYHAQRAFLFSVMSHSAEPGMVRCSFKASAEFSSASSL